MVEESESGIGTPKTVFSVGKCSAQLRQTSTRYEFLDSENLSFNFVKDQYLALEAFS